MEPFLGEIRLFPWPWAPTGWLLCNGAVLPIVNNQALASLLGNRYGGDGKTTFGVPDLRGRVPVDMGTSADITYAQGDVGGAEGVALTMATMPPHSHDTYGFDQSNATKAIINGNLPGKATLSTTGSATPIYSSMPNPLAETIALNSATIGPTGAGAPHPNMQPFLVLNFCIASSGLWPPQQ